jgi:hypothetical protein
MAQKPMIAPVKTRAIRKEKVVAPIQRTVDAKTTKAPIPKAPTAEEVNDLDWMKWVEYAQARLRYLENKLANAESQLAELKASNLGLQKRLLQG